MRCPLSAHGGFLRLRECLCMFMFRHAGVCVLEPRGASEGPGTACAPFPFVAESTDRKRAIDLWISYSCRSLCAACRSVHTSTPPRDPDPAAHGAGTLDSASCAASLSLCVTSSPSSSGTYDVRHYVKALSIQLKKLEW